MCGRYVVTNPVNKTKKIVKTSIKVENDQVSEFEKLLKTKDENINVPNSNENTGDLEKKIIDKIK